MDISVVIPIYIISRRLLQLTRDCLYSLKGQYDELVIVDDNSPLKTGEFKKQADIFLVNKKNEGYIKSANRGFRNAHGKYIILVCNDTVLLNGDLKDLCGKGYIFPTIVGKDIPFWDGAFYGFPRQIGGLYDERFKNYFGDLDKFYYAKMRGIPLTKTNKVLVEHLQSQTTKEAKIRTSAYLEDYEKFKKKWKFDPLKNYYKLI